MYIDSVAVLHVYNVRDIVHQDERPINSRADFLGVAQPFYNSWP